MQVSMQRSLGSLVFIILLLASIGAGAAAGLLFVYNSDLPQVQLLEDYRPSVITEVYADDGQVIGSFALERRIVLSWDQFPPILKNAIVAVEDQSFYEHWGLDFYGIARAGIKNLMAGRVVEGGSTITQQLSKLLFLTPERSFRRKIQEALLAIQIERNYTKPQVLTLYLNQVFLGHGMYGFAAAAEFYFGKNVKDLTIEEAAMLAALPRAPAVYSPITNPERALMRRNYAIDRMVAEGMAAVAEGEDAKQKPLQLVPKRRPDELAPYFVEELRRYLEKTYGTAAVHEHGLKVYSTLNVEMQKAANVSLRQRLRQYDKRHAWRGVERNLLSEGIVDLRTFELPEWKLPFAAGDIVPGVVVEIPRDRAVVRIGEYRALVGPGDIGWTNARSPADILKRGDVALFLIRSINPAERRLELTLEQKPQVQGAVLAVESQTGEVKAMVGGYDFDASKFNRATQALRQAGSAFKPFVYTAAVEQGVKPDDIVHDSPVDFDGYAPTNYDGKYEGSITIRRAFAQSRNIPAVRLLAQIGVDTLIPYVRRFGITSKLDRYLPIALGSADVTLLEMTAAYSVFPNGGVRAVPRMIRRVTDYDGDILEENLPELQDVIPASSSRDMLGLLQEVVSNGTATQAKILNRPVAGKTGTTNDFTDAWFIGFTPSLTCGVWFGFDDKITLGNGETGAKAALPIWIDFMQQVFKDKPVETFKSGETLLISSSTSERQLAQGSIARQAGTTPERRPQP